MPTDNTAKGSTEHTPNLPDLWDQAQVDAILLQISDGKSTRDACLDVGISRSTFASWVIKDINGLGGQYAHARALQMAAMEDEIVAIADDSQKDTMTRRDGSGNEYDVPDHEWIARTKLRVDTRKWIMSKIAPKLYGERTDSTLTLGGAARIEFTVDPNESHARRIAERADAIDVPSTQGMANIEPGV